MAENRREWNMFAYFCISILFVSVASEESDDQTKFIEGDITDPLLAPENIQIREGIDWVSITWHDPGVLRNRNILGYKIFFTDNLSLPLTQWESVLVKDSNAQNWTIGSLKKSTTYYFRLCAFDERGDGPLTQEYKRKTTLSLYRPLLLRPSPPQQIHIRQDTRKVDITWELPRKANGLVIAYEIFFTNDSSLPLNRWTIFDVPIRDQHQSRRFNIPDLRTNHTYTIHMRTINKYGPGRLSDQQNFTTGYKSEEDLRF